MLFLVRIISSFVSRHTYKKTHTSLLLLSFSSLSCAHPHMYTHTQLSLLFHITAGVF